MTTKQFNALIKKFGGWTDNGVAYFPSVYQREQFEKAAK